VIRLLVATRNRGKLREIEALVREGGIEGLTLETLADHPEIGEIEETGETFEENARTKAETAARSAGTWALGEDSGLVVSALGGAPGVRSARYAGGHGDDAANNAKLLQDLASAPDRRAHYVCVAALARPNGKVVAVARGTCDGAIASKPRGSGGFGYDPLFLPEGDRRTMAELTPAEKGALSHRGRALRMLIPEIPRFLAEESEAARRKP
jgi:XTP/dITP diphosphohydrolase